MGLNDALHYSGNIPKYAGWPYIYSDTLSILDNNYELNDKLSINKNLITNIIILCMF